MTKLKTRAVQSPLQRKTLRDVRAHWQIYLIILLPIVW